jgi:NitT/TauT family transport system substrate-binding protein
MNRSRMLSATGAAAAAVAFPNIARAQAAIPVRFALIGSGGQDEVSDVITQFGFDKKYGLALQVIDFTLPGQQYPMFRGDAIDVSGGNFVDLLRQRKAGIGLRAFRGFQGYNNVMVTKPDSSIKTFADLRGKKIGEFGTTFLDWLIVRAAGQKAYNLDLEKEAQLAAGAPPLLNQFLAKGDIDATLQFISLALGPIAQGQQRVITSIPELMRAAGFNPECFYLQWHVSEKWTSAHPGAIDRVNAMLDDAYAKLRSDDSVWPALAQKIHITDPALVTAYRNEDRKHDDPPHNPILIGATQKLLDAIVAIAGAEAVGVTTVDPAAFIFPKHSRR